jgi:hypothetical protein
MKVGEAICRLCGIIVDVDNTADQYPEGLHVHLEEHGATTLKGRTADDLVRLNFEFPPEPPAPDMFGIEIPEKDLKPDDIHAVRYRVAGLVVAREDFQAAVLLKIGEALAGAKQ